jgi:YHS domain-containing protein
MKKFALPLALLAGMSFSVVFAAAAGVEDPINKKCPIKGTDVVAGRTVEYKKQLIGFCCADCVAKFEGEPEKYIKKVKEFKKTQAE